jgi:hypothetical protein
MSSSKIFCTINVATVFDNSEPVSMMRKHKGMISVCSKKLITSASSILTSAPMTPNDVKRNCEVNNKSRKVCAKRRRRRKKTELENRDFI